MKKYMFPKLGEEVKIISSLDKKLTVISWDWLNNGSQQIYESAYRYINEEDKIITGFLSEEATEDNPFASATYFNIEDLGDNGYLIQGYGTEGAGREHFIYRFLRGGQQVIQDCENCFDGQSLLVYEVPRGASNPMEYDTNASEITFPKYEENEDTGALQKTATIVRYKLGADKNFKKVQ